MQKFKVIHVRVEGQANQGQIAAFENLCEQFVAQHPRARMVACTVTPVAATSASMFTAIFNYIAPLDE